MHFILIFFLDRCEEIAGEFVASESTSSKAIVMFHRGNISSMFFDDTKPNFRGSIKASTNPNECVGVVKYESSLEVILTYNKNSCVLRFSGNSVSWSWKKLFCSKYFPIF